MTLSGEADTRLKTWIEELVPEQRDTGNGAQPLNLEELQISLGASSERGPTKQRRSHAA